ncbi:uncharacterized protein LAESUDRAFT_401777 [Laetiporus sulphureus 93-53]|uniref:Uncharacterized protein n=1 Tax=Laetiporus sulphureus 93-53 TaxID=1314785 RepID=A0A165CBM4_9APHY|nr:uncharacterized protein LAESUDRAFT_401777 [Laetiporus sulphureus 93-53]KZT02515.1 hypothetical protein LAESUDRAFT_401777 [Laetiporus sulphureus 93-53]
MVVDVQPRLPHLEIDHTMREVESAEEQTAGVLGEQVQMSVRACWSNGQIPMERGPGCPSSCPFTSRCVRPGPQKTVATKIIEDHDASILRPLLIQITWTPRCFNLRRSSHASWCPLFGEVVGVIKMKLEDPNCVFHQCAGLQGFRRYTNRIAFSLR